MAKYWCVQGIEVGLPARNLRQPLIPPTLKLADDESVTGISSIELALRPCRLEACLVQRQLQLPALGLIVPSPLNQ
jgi:hypothetical protein